MELKGRYIPMGKFTHQQQFFSKVVAKDSSGGY